MEYRTMTRQLFKPTVSENLNVDHKVTLTEGEISTILYYLDQVADDIGESYIASLEVQSIYSKLETVVDTYYDKLDRARSQQPNAEWED